MFSKTNEILISCKFCAKLRKKPDVQVFLKTFFLKKP